MVRFQASLMNTRGRAATIVALLFAAQLSLFAHALGHDYAPDADQAHAVCALCIAAHQLDHGLASASLALVVAAVSAVEVRHACLAFNAAVRPAFLARAPPAVVSS